MIVREVMTSSLITLTPDDTLGHAANLFRQHQFHHLPVVRVAKAPEAGKSRYTAPNARLLLQGLLTSNDIDLAVELARQSSANHSASIQPCNEASASSYAQQGWKETAQRPWQEQHVGEVLHTTPISVTATTSVAAATQILVERGLHCLPVVEYAAAELPAEGADQDAPPLLIGLLTRSDLLIALAHMTGAFEPGMQLILPLPPHDVTPLAKMLLLAAELHIQVPSIVSTSHKQGVARVATVSISTMYPAPLLRRLHEEGIQYRSVLQQVLYAGKRCADACIVRNMSFCI